MRAKAAATPNAVSRSGRPDLDRRDMLIARLPKDIVTLNGSLISTDERAEAEKFFVRYFDQALDATADAGAGAGAGADTSSMAAKMKYCLLVARHGKQGPLEHAAPEEAADL